MYKANFDKVVDQINKKVKYRIDNNQGILEMSDMYIVGRLVNHVKKVITTYDFIKKYRKFMAVSHKSVRNTRTPYWQNQDDGVISFVVSKVVDDSYPNNKYRDYLQDEEKAICNKTIIYYHNMLDTDDLDSARPAVNITTVIQDELTDDYVNLSDFENAIIQAELNIRNKKVNNEKLNSNEYYINQENRYVSDSDSEFSSGDFSDDDGSGYSDDDDSSGESSDGGNSDSE